MSNLQPPFTEITPEGSSVPPPVPPSVLTVTLAVSTMGARAEAVRLPAERAGVDHLILVQAAPVADLAKHYATRRDVRVVILDTLGLSKSRNAALAQATGDLIVFCDDDLGLDLDGIMALAKAFEQDGDLALAAGWRSRGSGAQMVGRRGRTERLTLFNSGRICAPELMVRRTAFGPNGVRFDTDFGLGARHGLGEEYVFVTDAFKAGLKGMSLPIITGQHDDISTGSDWDDPALMRGRQQVLSRVFGPWAWMIRPVYAWRHRRRLGSMRAVFGFALNRL